jgi:osmotically-inducible protein OsmY
MWMRNWMLLPLALAALACSRAEDRASTDSVLMDEEQVAAAPDTRQFDEPEHGEGLTPMDQGNSEADLSTSQRIRAAVVEDDSLSMTAKNVKIITLHGRVTLRGRVDSERERQAVVEAARSVAGEEKVVDQLEVSADYGANPEVGVEEE